MRRRDFLAAAPAWLGAQPARPNILLLFTDDQRFDTIRALGNQHVSTPNLDRLVRNGTAFTQACIMGGTLGAVCVPSRAMLWTGQSLFHAHAALIAPNASRPFDLTPKLLQKAGYVTFGTGKWHNGEKNFARAFSTGGPVMFGGMADHSKVSVADYDPSGVFPKEQRRTGSKFSSELFADAVIEFLEKQTAAKPFFAYAGFMSPHDPRMAPERFARIYDPAKLPLPPNFAPEHPFDNGEMKIRDEMLEKWPRTGQAVREHLAAYYAMVSEVDAQIGRVLGALERTGLDRNTFVIFAADNGLAVGQHGLLGKQNLYDHSVRIPLVIAGPGLPKGKKNDSLVYLLDVAPTICEIAGAPPPRSAAGHSLLPIVKSGGRLARSSQFFAYRGVQRGIRNARSKLILYNAAGKQTTQFFDLAQDPWETRDLSRDPRYAKRIAGMRTQLAEWMQRVDDPMKLDSAGGLTA